MTDRLHITKTFDNIAEQLVISATNRTSVTTVTTFAVFYLIFRAIVSSGAGYL